MITKGAKNDILLGASGSYSTARDILKHRVWDTYPFAATIGNHVFFSQPQGSQWKAAGQAKRLNETNVTTAGQLPNGQTFLVKRIGVSLISPLAQNQSEVETLVQSYYNIMQSSVFDIQIAGRSYDYQIHGREFLPAVAVCEVGTANVNRVGDFITGGWSSLDNTPIFIDQLVNFNVNLTLNNADANVVTILNAGCADLLAAYCAMQVTLEGTLTRAK